MRNLPAGSWLPISAGYLVYASMFAAGSFTHRAVLLSAGGLAMVFISSVGNYQRLFTVRVGPPVRWALLAMLPPTLGLFLYPSARIDLVLKFDLLLLVFVQIYSWRLPPLNRSPWRWALLGVCLAVILLSVLSGNSFEAEGTRRLQGLFPNPNNLALLALALPLFLNDDDGWLWQVLVHAVTITMLVLTSTMGAFVAYGVGIAYRLRTMLTARRAIIAFVLVVLPAGVLLSKQDLSQLRFLRSFSVILDSMNDQSLAVVQRGAVEYGGAVDAHGEGSTSGLWRMVMWWAVGRTYGQGSPTQWIVGRGLGACEDQFGILPHNDYLRLLFETGALGLIAFLGLCWSAWRGMQSSDRYVVAMVLTYCVSENNLDNFLVMSLFMFFLASTQPPVRPTEEPIAWNARVRRAWFGDATAPSAR